MHEWALAEAVISTAVEFAEKTGFEHITEIEISIGELQQIEEDPFLFALEEMLKEKSKPVDKNTKITLEKENAILKCKSCKHEWDYLNALNELDEEKVESIHFVPEVSHAFIKCPKCNSPDFEITNGRGVWINNIIGK
ncbi:MAG: hydrogenase nickel incorporation protein HypA [Candidatus Diapherotrites archaeon]|nr:hydrogenase nickel incorporation protein HypA [Candidatus Diapherotrites archaeon]